MSRVYDAEKLKICIIRHRDPSGPAAWRVEYWTGSDAPLAKGVADTYQLACAAAGEAFARLTAP